jgi:hypothetical protein
VGVYWNLVNPGKREYLGPHHLGWGRKMRGILNGPPAYALSLLVCASPRWDRPAGGWHGDAVYFADDGGPADEGFTDISREALVAVADEWVTQAMADEVRLVDLGYAAITTRAEVLAGALERRLGRGWAKHCEKAFTAHPDRLY